MDVAITAFASSRQLEELCSALQRLGFRPWHQRDGCQGGGAGMELLYVAGGQDRNGAIGDLLAGRTRPFDLLVAGRDLFQVDGLLDHALDFCCWPVDDLELVTRLKRVERLRIDRPSEDAGSRLSGDECRRLNLVGRSPLFLQVVDRIRRLAPVDANVLISGETGTGKELAARALHQLSPRSDRCFQAVNCGAIPENLVENELFGHVSGAFTDARRDQAGLIERAHRGTLFLDEVDMLPPKAQSALLRFIESRLYRPLGGREERKADTRIIAATNADLGALAARGSFRLDLYYRLNLLNLRLPSLRLRRDDTMVLVDHFLSRCESVYGRGRKVLHPFTRARVAAYGWPGNVRELEHFIHREYLLADSPVIVATPFAGESLPEDGGAIPEPPPASFRQAKQQAINRFESEYVRALLDRTAGNITRAARLAGKERRAFGRLVKKHGIDPQQFAAVR